MEKRTKEASKLEDERNTLVKRIQRLETEMGKPPRDEVVISSPFYQILYQKSQISLYLYEAHTKTAANLQQNIAQHEQEKREEREKAEREEALRREGLQKQLRDTESTLARVRSERDSLEKKSYARSKKGYGNETRSLMDLKETVGKLEEKNKKKVERRTYFAEKGV